MQTETKPSTRQSEAPAATCPICKRDILEGRATDFPYGYNLVDGQNRYCGLRTCAAKLHELNGQHLTRRGEVLKKFDHTTRMFMVTGAGGRSPLPAMHPRDIYRANYRKFEVEQRLKK